MNILFHLHTYAPNHTSGADIYAERIATWLADRCTVKVIIDNCPEPYIYNNHTIESNKFRIAENYEWCDAVITNLVTNNQATWLSERFKKPLFHIVHNATMPTIQRTELTHIIYNSYTLQKLRPLNFPSIVVQPITWSKDWKRSASGQYITLINLTHNKGAETLRNLAVNMSQCNFLGVRGGYGQQYMQATQNLNIMPFTKDMQSVYDQTRVLIVPSLAETWSLCAAEAQCCGIPVVCSDLPGLRENLEDSAIYVNSLRGFIDALRSDLTPYIELGFARQQEREKNHILQLENLFSFMKEKVIKQDKPVVKEKVVKPTVKEKKIINKPSTKQNN